MTASRPVPITPELRVGEFLEAYPDLEPVLVAQAPAFANLRNPVLRRTVAKVATLAQAARVGGVPVKDLVARLRQAAGQSVGPAETADEQNPTAAPAWYDPQRVTTTVDADAMLARGEHPLGAMQRHALALEGDDILCLDSGFVPAPLVDAFRGQGLDVATFALEQGRYRTCIRRPHAG